MAQTGNLSIHTENIFPIIKKFLYSDHDVFLRELVSNAVDATSKLQALASKGEVKGELGDLTIQITIDPDKKTITISDKGIGLTADEVEKYINQIAFSSAEEFLHKYKDTDTQIIGHFGLGFYSAFMVAQKVEIFSLSYQDSATAVHWSCEGSVEYTLEPTEKTERGTDIILHIAPEHEEYLSSYRINEILKKHCKYLPIPISFEGKVINNTKPAWIISPSELKEEDYINFYNDLYPFSEKPLFWIHLNVDYPFTLTGILYFPRIKPNTDFQKNKILLYSNQVFITDNVEGIVPDFLSLLNGVIDSPDIPLNVSRSSLQTDANVRKISGHIAKKVADKLTELYYDNKEEYAKKWESIGVFVKYGMVRDNAFYDRVKKVCLVFDTQNNSYTLDELQSAIQTNQTDKDGNIIILYTTDLLEQHNAILLAEKKGYKTIVLDGIIDSHFISFMESRLDKVRFVRVDAATPDKLIDKV